MEKRKNRFSDKDFALIKATFAENEELIDAMRKLFLQLPLDVLDQAQLDSAFKDKPEVLKIVHRCYLPSLSEPWPILQIYDHWLVDVKDKSPMEAYSLLKARGKTIKYLEEQMARLESGDYGVKKGSIILDSLIPDEKKDEIEVYEDILARNTIISSNESQLNMLSILAGQKSETEEQMIKRIEKNSSK